MKIMLATLALNEMEWLPRLYQQHKDWPGLVGWVFVEAADPLYAGSNPGSVHPVGLSTDGTNELLAKLQRDEPLVTHVPHGVMTGGDPAQRKCSARNRYLEIADCLEPDWIVVLDADEFYTKKDQAGINHWIDGLSEHFTAALFRQRHIWFPPHWSSMLKPAVDDTFFQEVVGGYWGVPHCRVWRWSYRMRYTTNHNVPTLYPDRASSVEMSGQRVQSYDNMDHAPQCVHMGFASALESRQAKHKYYQARGEGKGDGRSMHVACRRAWEGWKPGDALPAGAQVIDYKGPVPEVFRD